MLKIIYMELGAAGTLAVAALVIATVFSWTQAIAGVVVSGMSGGLKMGVIGALSVFPPVSILIIGAFVFKSGRQQRENRGERARIVRLRTAPDNGQQLKAKPASTQRILLKPSPVYSEVA